MQPAREVNSAASIRFDLTYEDVERILLWYADSHSTGDPDEDDAQSDLADVFKNRARMAGWSK